jgi:predicted HicB family RNase H-like nuclease
MSPKEAVRLSVSITTRQHDALKQEADRLEISIGELVRRVLDGWVDEKERGA